jgi:hypothetical protein
MVARTVIIHHYHMRPPPQFSPWGCLVVTGIVAAILLLFAMLPAGAQEFSPGEYSETPPVHHHEGMSPAVDRFYSTWFRPDLPDKSCCNKNDCYPTKAIFKDGQWWALRRDDDKYLPIPWEKVERNRDSPDGRSHLCAPVANHVGYVPDVFCFILGGGT